MKQRIIPLLVIVLLLATTASVSAQSYSFSLPSETVNVFWNDDGTMSLDYVFVFQNDGGAPAIEYVDVGMPNDSFEWNSISADTDGHSLNISTDYQGEGGSGFSVEMGGYSIQAGQSGSLHVYVGRISNILYPSDTNPDTHVSGQFSPNWFGASYVHGDTNLTVIFHLPTGVQPAESIYYPATGGWPCGENPETDLDNQGRVKFTWACPNANAHTQYIFGLSFPKQYVPAGAMVTPTPPPSTSSGFSDFISMLTSSMGTICCVGFFILMFVGAPVLGAINERKRKLQYLPPKISIEGHGIKRGLTAVEAAILMEQPLDKVMTMILFGVAKKGAATVVTRDPLKLKVAQPLPEGLHGYESDFLHAFADDALSAQRKGLQEMTVNLVQSVSEKMKGFSRKETADYYRNIMERAWEQIEAANTPEVKSDMYDKAMEWTMLDDKYDDRTRRVFTGPVFLPMWWGNYDPTYHPISTPSVATTGGTGKVASSMPSSSGRPSGVPGAAFAASVVNGVQGFSSRVLGDVKAFTSGVTNRTNPLPKTSTASGGWKGGSGGHSCACACACAGCACACAGGGR